MSYTLGEAAKATGMSKAAISRAIKNGTLSAEKQENGSYRIDPAELHRVYPPVSQQRLQQQATETDDATKLNPALNAENRELRAKLESAEQRLRDRDEVIADLREDRDRWRAQAERLLLADQRTQPASAPAPAPTETAAPARRRWWHFGGKG